MREPINNPEQVEKNIRRYNQDLPNSPYLQDLLSNHRDWYYLNDLEIFGPSKFIGYVDMTGQRYTQAGEEEGSFDGGFTQKTLSKFFVESDDLSLFGKLESLMYPYNKTPRSNVRFYVRESL
jgi:hypothetical protein